VPARSKPAAREWFEQIAIAIIMALFVRTFVLQTFKIPSGSMETTLLVGDQLIVDRFGARPIARGQVLVFKSPEEPDKDLIKRVIGLPGEVIELRGQQILIDGRPLEEPYARYFPASMAAAYGITPTDVRRAYGPVTVPADHYFMMGDNRDNSRDSRFYGFMPRSYVRGRALFVHFSLGGAEGVRWGRILHQIR
jgi:signal peptidase I